MKKMSKIFYYVEHTSKTEANSGVQRVVRGLARALQEISEEVIFVRWCADTLSLVRIDELQLNHLAKWAGPSPINLQSTGDPIHIDPRDNTNLAGSWLIIPEVTHLTFNSAPATESILLYTRRFGIKTAALVYDLIPLKCEEYSYIKEIHSEYLQHLALADILIPISKSVSDDLRHYYKNTAPTAKYLLPVIKPLLLPHELAGVSRQEFEESHDNILILSVGTVEPRKNQIALIEAFARFRASYPEINCQLKIIGNIHPIMLNQIAEQVSSISGVELLNYVSDDELISLYSKTAFSVFPSIEEGYGLPIAESLWLGVPCICANFGSMAEISEGGGALTVDTKSADDLYFSLEKMIKDRDLRIRLRREAASRNLTTWSEYADHFINLLNESPGISSVVVWVNSTVSYHGNSGIQRVVRQLTAALETIGVDVSFVAWNNYKKSFRSLTEQEFNHLSLWNGPSNFNNFESINDLREAWLILPELILPDPNAEQVIIAAKQKGMKVATIFYDLIPITLTDIYPPECQNGFHIFFKMISQSDLIIPISKTMGDDLYGYYCKNLDRLATIRSRIEPIVLPGEFRTFKRQLNEKVENDKTINILMVGTIEPRKNHLVVIHGFRKAISKLQLIDQDVTLKLIFCGSTIDHAYYAQGIRDEVAGDQGISFIESPSDEQLAELYFNCDFTVFPSLIEGFGLPVLESLWFGRPCICSNNGAVAEVADGGGCITFDPHNGDQLGDIIFDLALDRQKLHELSIQSINRKIKGWNEYANEITWLLRNNNPTFPTTAEFKFPVWSKRSPKRRGGGVLLSVCISTYNRAEWLRHSLNQIFKSASYCEDNIEILVVDNSSTDNTSHVVEEFMTHSTLRYHRNEFNVGMLGNLAVTSKLARGEYIWILGDDDLIREGAIPRILDIIKDNPRSEIIYLNYSYTHYDRPEELQSIEQVFLKSTPIATPSKSHFVEQLKDIAGYTENLFTAIYACVFRYDHAIGAYTQDTSGAPFSDLITCIPTSVYVLNHMINRPAYWVGDPYVVVNMNVSWRKWVLIWHLERMPDLFDLAERKGVMSEQLEPYRRNHCADAANWARNVYFGDDDNLLSMFSMERLIERCKHIPEFKSQIFNLRQVYNLAYIQNRVVSDNLTAARLFEMFDLLQLRN